jgi:DHA3 family macrolide efflux protein-like MFS transporter
MNSQTTSPTPTVPANWAPRFFTIWTGQAFSLVGSALVQFALVWWLTSQTGSATILATASLVALLPQIVLGPFVGALVDRWNRRAIMIAADAAIAAATGILLLLFAAGLVQVWHVYVIMLLRSLGGAFHGPAMSASTTLMVPDRHLARVAGANQLLQGLIGIFAPPMGALLINLMSTEGVLLIDILTAAAAVFSLLAVAIPQPARQLASAEGAAVKGSYWTDLRAGFRYVWSWPGLLGLILLAMMLNFLLSPSGSLLPLLVMDEFGGGVRELAWVESAFGIGIILGGLLLSVWGGFKRRIQTSFAGIVGIGVGVLLSGLIPGEMFWLLLAACLTVGFAQVFANGPLNAIFQTAVAPEMQGRVFSLIGAGATAMMPLSLLIAGPVADGFGIRTWYLLGGAVCLLVTLAAAFVPAIMNIEQNKVTRQPAEVSR